MHNMLDKPKGVLFDLDGTLLDTARDLGNALNWVLQQHKMPSCAFSVYRNIASDGSQGLLEIGFGDRLADYDVESLKALFLERYEKEICVDTVSFNGIKELLARLDKDNIPWGIVTNKPQWLTELLLPHFDEFAQCQVVISGDTLEKRKPHPLPLIHAANAMNIDPADCWYIGDAKRDIDAAKAANMFSVVANYGYIGPEHRSDSWNADLYIDQPQAILAHL
ncbi:MAG: phosphoglycolate phosphatase [Alteromonadaceae bacterium]|nr:phosphoglycolate phosphatase [Alteromonadaceae bacterium]MBB19373.1 phosphoglycolate phosphatase [Rickettsiales bacterium]|tara:strand:+ start:734 stop:1399 length:666 start_codon:yes stop_codon:yes gene_type:complete|eukprot:TRINITY_DN5370_c0_g2_i2.p1 TRINITY_DN5370_c0_g2~~TRINITY_DN5370_c0_g2_i2.p1  ORF type:complete len:222 (-),score=37.72 TRINITY_DN5370_c0_g2_i2:58-723(-)